VQFLYVGATQAPQSGEDFIAPIMKGHMSTGEMTDRRILIDGDTAVIVETDTVIDGDAVAEVARQYQIMTTYVRRRGHWRVLADHVQTVPARGTDPPFAAAPAAQ